MTTKRWDLHMQLAQQHTTMTMCRAAAAIFNVKTRRIPTAAAERSSSCGWNFRGYLYTFLIRTRICDDARKTAADFSLLFFMFKFVRWHRESARKKINRQTWMNLSRTKLSQICRVKKAIKVRLATVKSIGNLSVFPLPLSGSLCNQKIIISMGSSGGALSPVVLFSLLFVINLNSLVDMNINIEHWTRCAVKRCKADRRKCIMEIFVRIGLHHRAPPPPFAHSRHLIAQCIYTIQSVFIIQKEKNQHSKLNIVQKHFSHLRRVKCDRHWGKFVRFSLSREPPEPDWWLWSEKCEREKNYLL